MKMDAEHLEKTILKYCKQFKVTTIRFFERDKSYEDFSVSFKLPDRNGFREMIPNFKIITDDENTKTNVYKKSRTSTRHITFDSDSDIEITIRGNKQKVIAVSILSDIYYTDGTHRYKKDTKKGIR